MLLAVLLFTLVAVGHADMNQLIVGGEKTTHGEHPYSCVLDSQSWWGSWSFICGCVIWNSKYVVTAAHCVNPSGNYRIRAGVHNINEQSGIVQAIAVARVIQHPNYNANGQGYPNDIALLELAGQLTYNSYVCGGKFAYDIDESFEGTKCKLTGFGRTIGGSTATVQKKVNMEKIRNNVCDSMWRPISGARIYDFHICFYEGNGYSACNGDSGGPVRCGSVITGITSWGISTCSGDYPSVYTRVSHYYNWLTGVARENEPCPFDVYGDDEK